MLFIGVAVEHKLSTVSMFILAILIYICVITIYAICNEKICKRINRAGYVQQLGIQHLFSVYWELQSEHYLEKMKKC